MLEPSEQPTNQATEEEALSLEPLGIQNPLLPPKPLGANLLQPKFLYPLGARPLSGFDTSAAALQTMPDYSVLEGFILDEPVSARSQAQSVGNPTNTASAASETITPQIQTRSLEQSQATYPTTSQPQAIIQRQPAEEITSLPDTFEAQESLTSSSATESTLTQSISATSTASEKTAPSIQTRSLEQSQPTLPETSQPQAIIQRQPAEEIADLPETSETQESPVSSSSSTESTLTQAISTTSTTSETTAPSIQERSLEQSQPNLPETSENQPIIQRQPAEEIANLSDTPETQESPVSSSSSTESTLTQSISKTPSVSETITPQIQERSLEQSQLNLPETSQPQAIIQRQPAEEIANLPETFKTQESPTSSSATESTLTQSISATSTASETTTPSIQERSLEQSQPNLPEIPQPQAIIQRQAAEEIANLPDTVETQESPVSSSSATESTLTQSISSTPTVLETTTPSIQERSQQPTLPETSQPQAIIQRQPAEEITNLPETVETQESPVSSSSLTESTLTQSSSTTPSVSENITPQIQERSPEQSQPNLPETSQPQAIIQRQPAEEIAHLPDTSETQESSISSSSTESTLTQSSSSTPNVLETTPSIQERSQQLALPETPQPQAIIQRQPAEEIANLPETSETQESPTSSSSTESTLTQSISTTSTASETTAPSIQERSLEQSQPTYPTTSEPQAIIQRQASEEIVSLPETGETQESPVSSSSSTESTLTQTIGTTSTASETTTPSIQERSLEQSQPTLPETPQPQAIIQRQASEEITSLSDTSEIQEFPTSSSSTESALTQSISSTPTVLETTTPSIQERSLEQSQPNLPETSQPQAIIQRQASEEIANLPETSETQESPTSSSSTESTLTQSISATSTASETTTPSIQERSLEQSQPTLPETSQPQAIIQRQASEEITSLSDTSEIQEFPTSSSSTESTLTQSISSTPTASETTIPSIQERSLEQSQANLPETPQPQAIIQRQAAEEIANLPDTSETQESPVSSSSSTESTLIQSMSATSTTSETTAPSIQERSLEQSQPNLPETPQPQAIIQRQPAEVQRSVETQLETSSSVISPLGTDELVSAQVSESLPIQRQAEESPSEPTSVLESEVSPEAIASDNLIQAKQAGTDSTIEQPTVSLESSLEAQAHQPEISSESLAQRSEEFPAPSQSDTTEIPVENQPQSQLPDNTAVIQPKQDDSPTVQRQVESPTLDVANLGESQISDRTFAPTDESPQTQPSESEKTELPLENQPQSQLPDNTAVIQPKRDDSPTVQRQVEFPTLDAANLGESAISDRTFSPAPESPQTQPLAAPSESLPTETSSSSASVVQTQPETQATPDSEVTVAQLFSESKQPPALPTVLENIAQLKPLGQSNALGQPPIEAVSTSPLLSSSSTSNLSADFPSIIQRMPESVDGELPQISDRINESSPMTSSNGSSSNLGITQNVDTSDRVSPSADIPSSWSSIAELLGDSPTIEPASPVIQRYPERQPSSVTSSKPTVIQRRKEERQPENEVEELIFTPEGFQRADSGSDRSSRTSRTGRSVIQTKKRDRQALQKKTNNSSTSSNDISIQMDSEPGSQPITITALNSSSQDESGSMDSLAREVYNMLRQRLEIERERRGSNYLGRMPW